MSPRRKLQLVLAICLSAVGIVAGSARADSATVYQQSCSINGVQGNGLAVFLGNGMLNLTSCHTGSMSSPPLVIKSGTCTTVGDRLNVCAGQ